MPNTLLSNPADAFGRSAAAKRFDPDPVRLAVIVAVRHQFTNYDRFLLVGIERREARARVRSDVDGKLNQWSQANAELRTARDKS